MVRGMFVILASAAAQDPDRPHLSQAWSAQSSGDGLPDTVGQEHYINIPGQVAGHIFDYGANNCIKTVICDRGDDRFCTAYYEKCDAVDCCYCDDATFKPWDIESGTFTKVHFNGYEDTTELNENPIAGAEHWNSNSSVPFIGRLSVAYDYFIHREENQDVISHRIDYHATGVQGSILYGDFQVQHDLDAHAARFQTPQRCLGNIVDCGCDDDGANSWSTRVEARHFKHAHMMKQLQKAAGSTVSV